MISPKTALPKRLMKRGSIRQRQVPTELALTKGMVAETTRIRSSRARWLPGPELLYATRYNLLGRAYATPSDLGIAAWRFSLHLR